MKFSSPYANVSSIAGRVIVCLAGLILVCTTVLSQSQPAQLQADSNSHGASAPKSEIQAPTSNTQQSDLRLGRGDLVEVTVFSSLGSPELNTKSRVNAMGELSVPLIGSLPVAGLTVQEAQTTIAKRYQDGEILKNPTVMVFVSEYVNQGVSVLGEVAKPGVYNVLSSRRLLDMISEAGGLTPMAGRVATISHRSDPKEPVVVTLSRDATQAPANNVEVFPGDTIMVGKAGVIYVVGAVSKPGGFPMDANEGLTVLQALALAEGSKPDAALDRSKLIRKTPNGPVEVPIPLKKILSSKTADQKLQTDDILFVPNSAAKSAAKRTMEAIIQTATGVAIYSRR